MLKIVFACLLAMVLSVAKAKGSSHPKSHPNVSVAGQDYPAPCLVRVNTGAVINARAISMIFQDDDPTKVYIRLTYPNNVVIKVKDTTEGNMYISDLVEKIKQVCGK